MPKLSFLRCLILPLAALAATTAVAQETTECRGMPGTYVKLFSQPYALCAGATTVNYNEVTYAKCLRLKGNSISLQQQYPVSDGAVLTIPNSGDIATMNARSRGGKGYVMSTYSPPAGAIFPKRDLAIYTCEPTAESPNYAGSYAQCDGGICFNSTTGKTAPLWGKVKANEVICSCPVVKSESTFQVVGPGDCPTTAAEYDKVCGKALTSVGANANGAIHYIGAPTSRGYEALSICLQGVAPIFNRCVRPTSG